jgi:hypothetical protein
VAQHHTPPCCESPLRRSPVVLTRDFDGVLALVMVYEKFGGCSRDARNPSNSCLLRESHNLLHCHISCRCLCSYLRP